MSMDSVNAAGSASRHSKYLKRLNRQVKARRLKKYLRAYAALPSRHFLHSGNRYAVQMLCDDLKTISEKFHVKTQGFIFEDDDEHKHLLHNVEARLPASDSMEGKPVVVICAHMDCTADGDPACQPLLDRAPGADDNASGIAAVLLAAHAIEKLRQIDEDLVPYREIRFVLFNAEEARQRGSRAYVASLTEKVVAAYNLDMIGYASTRNIFEVHAGYEGRVEQTKAEEKKVRDTQKRSLEMAALIERLQKEFAPGLQVQIYPGENDKRDVGEGFSDHTSFHQVGIPACLITENFFVGPGSIALSEPNPNHHLPEDLPEHLDFEYAANIARVVAAAAWYTAISPTWPPSLPGEAGDSTSGDHPESHSYGG